MDYRREQRPFFFFLLKRQIRITNKIISFMERRRIYAFCFSYNYFSYRYLCSSLIFLRNRLVFKK